MAEHTNDSTLINEQIQENKSEFLRKWAELKENIEKGSAGPVEKNGGWYIEVGTSLTSNEAFGAPTENEIEANRRKPLSQHLAELYPA